MQGPSSGGLGPAWTRGEIERPQGERDMGSWTASFYTPEQQQRLGVDEQGVAIQPATTSTHRMTLKQRARVVLLGVKLFRGALDQREVDAAADDEDGWARYEEEVVGGGGAAGGGEGVRPVPHRGEVAHPGLVPHIAEKIAEIKGVGVDDVFRAARAATEAVYGF